MKLGVKGKLMGLLAGISLTALALACAAFVYYDRVSSAEAKTRGAEILVDAVAQSAAGAVAFGDADSARYVLDSIEREATALSAAIYAADGSLLTSWQRDASTHRLPATAAELKAGHGIHGDVLTVRRPIAANGTPLGEFVAEFSTADIDARSVTFLSIAGLVLLFSFLGAWVAASFAQRVLTRPVANLVDAVTRVERDQDLTVRADKLSDDEMGTLTESFNRMVSAIQQRDAELEAHRADLERRVEERTRDLDLRNREMRLVLDNVDQGFVTIDPDGRLQRERSRAFDDFFTAPAEDATLSDHLEKQASGVGDALALGLEEVAADILPLDLTLEQLPARFEASGGRHFVMEYRPIMDGDVLRRLLVIVSDVTDQVARERSDALQAETIAMFESIMHDRAGFTDFFNEATRLMEQVLSEAPRELPLVLRDLHTLKGNFGIARMHRMASEVHELESECMEAGECPCGDRLEHLRNHWREFEARARGFLGEGADSLIVPRSEYDALLAALSAEGVSEETQAFAEALTLDPCGPRLRRLSEEASRLAQRLGLPALRVEVQGGEQRLPGGSAWLWTVLAHLVRNAVDHGLSGVEGRTPQLTLAALVDAGRAFSIRIADNGNGIDWEAVKSKAKSLGLPADSRADAIAALFADRFSTRDEATDISGRGVGLSAVKAEVESHGGRVTVESEPGAGTAFIVQVPLQALDAARAPGSARTALAG